MLKKFGTNKINSLRGVAKNSEADFAKKIHIQTKISDFLMARAIECKLESCPA